MSEPIWGDDSYNEPLPPMRRQSARQEGLGNTLKVWVLLGLALALIVGAAYLYVVYFPELGLLTAPPTATTTPVATPTPTVAPSPTLTPTTQPTASPTPGPTSSPTPTRTAQPKPTATPSPTPTPTTKPGPMPTGGQHRPW